MKVEYVLVTYEHKNPHGMLAGTPSKFCCEDMKDRWDEVIKFREYGPSVCLTWLESSWDEYLDETAPIRFCPFCGEPVEVQETGRVLRTQKQVEKTVTRTEWIEVDTPVEKQ